MRGRWGRIAPSPGVGRARAAVSVRVGGVSKVREEGPMAVAAVSTVGRSVRDRVGAEEWQTRVDLAALYRLVAKHGMTDLTATHISARVPGSHDQFLLNPHGLLFSQVTASNLVKIHLDGHVIDGGYGVNAAGFNIHSAGPAARPDPAQTTRASLKERA